MTFAGGAWPSPFPLPPRYCTHRVLYMYISEFRIIEEGVCGKSVSKETCQNEASKGGKTVEDINSKSQPKGCYYENGVAAFYYNSEESSTQECSLDQYDTKCYCVVDEDKEGTFNVFLNYIFP